MPKKDSFDSTGALPRQDIPLEFVPDKKEKIKVRQAKTERKQNEQKDP